MYYNYWTLKVALSFILPLNWHIIYFQIERKLHRYIFFTVYQFFNRSLVILLLTSNTYDVYISVRIFKNIWKICHIRSKYVKFGLKYVKLHWKYVKIAVFCPNLAICTSFLTAPTRFNKCEVYIPVENYSIEHVSCNLSLREVLSGDGMETSVFSFKVTVVEEDSAPN